ncbi:interactor of constitutive active ROPs 4-like isoform X2 [Typha angustifolia]|uniref:interactor of constitutive active ROPs 4-like isoform X2 n=2 Tax=Typha angustifolia TaxID=59011 RepID=UPI003C2EA1BB
MPTKTTHVPPKRTHTLSFMSPPSISTFGFLFSYPLSSFASLLFSSLLLRACQVHFSWGGNLYQVGGLFDGLRRFIFRRPTNTWSFELHHVTHMPRSRGSSELPQQRQSPRAPLHLRPTVCSESNSSHHRNASSPRSPLPEKKRGTRVASLEAKLTKAQEEMKKLREELASVEAAKLETQVKLEEAKKQISVSSQEVVEEEATTKEEEEESSTTSPATDVFEVVVPVESEKNERDDEQVAEKGTEETEKVIDDREVLELKAKLLEKEREVGVLEAENARLREKVEAAEEEMEKKAGRLREELEAAERARREMEAEIGRMRVQSEQWRKAAEEAAAVLEEGNGEGFVGRRVAGRCGSMDKHLVGGNGGVVGWGSPMVGGEELGFGGGKRRGGGMKMFGELWKKKGQQK